MAQLLANFCASNTTPFLSGAQFGNRYFLVHEDQRPGYIQLTGVGNNPKYYQCGIKPPLVKPTVANSGVSSTNLVPHQGAKVRIAYAFYSSVRNVFSRLSPYYEHTIAGSAEKLTVNAFETPRDSPVASDIDRIVICAQLGTASGFMSLWPEMTVDLKEGDPTYDFSTAAFTYDVPLVANASVAGLVDGFNVSAQDLYNEIPPAVKYIARFGERLWYAGQRDKVTFSNTGIFIDAQPAAANYRDKKVAKITLTGDGRLDDSHLHMSVWADNSYWGQIVDVDSATTAFLDRDHPADHPAGSNTTNFRFEGHNDRLYPSSYHQFNPGGVAITFPETIRLIDRHLMTEVLDEGKTLKGLKSGHDFMHVIFRDSSSILAGGNEINVPQPQLRLNQGRTGAIAERSITKDQSGNVVWIGEEGIQIGATGGVQSPAYQMGINDFFKGERGWIDKAALKNIKMAHSRFLDGYVLGDITINGVANNFAVVTQNPQPGLSICKTQRMTSNIIEYDNSNGRGTMLVGNNQRLIKLFDDTVLTDVTDVVADAAAAYTAEYRTGWMGQPDGLPFSLATLEIAGIIIPDEATVAPTLTLDHWYSDYPIRLEADLPSKASEETAQGGSYTKSLSLIDLRRKVTLEKHSARYHSISLRWGSNMGSRTSSDRVVGMEMIRFIIKTTKEVRGG